MHIHTPHNTHAHTHTHTRKHTVLSHTHTHTHTRKHTALTHTNSAVIGTQDALARMYDVDKTTSKIPVVNATMDMPTLTYTY